MEAVAHINKTKGIMGFYAGFGPFVARDIPFSAIQFPLYELLKMTTIRLLATRALFGIGEVAYMAVAPGILHDVYCDDSSRNYALLVFNGMIPIGG